MQKHEITKLTGVNLRQKSTDINDSDSQKCVNFDVSAKPGSIIIRKGKEDLGGSTLADLILRYISKVNGFRYQVAGRNLYRDMVQITADETFNEAQIETTIIPFRDLSDAYIWGFVADDDAMLKDNGTVLYIWGIDLVPTPDPQIANQT